MSYRGEPFDESYFNGNHAGGYTDFSKLIFRAIPRADDIQSYFGKFEKQDKVLVIGCAYGFLVDELASRDGGEHEVIGVDISSYAIGEAQKLYPSRTFQNIDFFNHSFTPDYFNLIILERVIECMPDKITDDFLFDELEDILATNGMIYILTDDTPVYYSTKTDPEYQEYVDSGVMIGKSIEITDVGHLPLGADKRVVIQ